MEEKIIEETEEVLENNAGNVPEELMLYIYEKTMDKYCETLDIYKIDRSKKDSLVFYITSNTSSNMDGNKLFSALPLDNSITLGYSKAKEIYIILNGLINHKLDRFISICNFFELICQK